MTASVAIDQTALVGCVDLCRRVVAAAERGRPAAEVEDLVYRLRDMLSPLLRVGRRPPTAGGELVDQDLLFVYGLANGMDLGEIAGLLGLRHDQARQRIKTIRERVGARNDAHLVAIAAGRGQLWL